MGHGRESPLRSSDSSAILPVKSRTRSDHPLCEACSVRGIAVCGAMNSQELLKFGAEMSNIKMDAGDTLINEGDPERYVFSVLSGCLKCYKLMADGRRQITGFLFPGDFLGLAKSDEYAYSVEAIGGAGLCRMERNRLTALSADIPNLEHRLHDLASEALTDLQDHILLLGRKTAQERVASFLLGLAKRARLRGEAGNPVEVPMGRDDIGDFLGLTTETVSRTFSRLRKAGLIGSDRDRRITILDMDRLMETAEGG